MFFMHVVAAMLVVASTLQAYEAKWDWAVGPGKTVTAWVYCYAGGHYEGGKAVLGKYDGLGHFVTPAPKGATLINSGDAYPPAPRKPYFWATAKNTSWQPAVLRVTAFCER